MSAAFLNVTFLIFAILVGFILAATLIGMAAGKILDHSMTSTYHRNQARNQADKAYRRERDADQRQYYEAGYGDAVQADEQAENKRHVDEIKNLLAELAAEKELRK